MREITSIFLKCMMKEEYLNVHDLNLCYQQWGRIPILSSCMDGWINVPAGTWFVQVIEQGFLPLHMIIVDMEKVIMLHKNALSLS